MKRQTVIIKIKTGLLYLLLIISSAYCSKDRSPGPELTDAASLLTAKSWKLLSHGYDNNKDGVISSSEEALLDCERDNISTFNKNGTGIVLENELVCSGNKNSSQFNWSLINNDTMLDFNFGIAVITKLTADSLVITDNNSDDLKMIVIYGH